MEDEYVKCDFRYFQAHKTCYFFGVFRDCDFSCSDLEDCVFSGEFYNCDMTGVNFSYATFRHCKFVGCDLRAATFKQVKGLFTAVVSTGCILKDFMGAKAQIDAETDNYRLIHVQNGSDEEGKVCGVLKPIIPSASPLSIYPDKPLVKGPIISFRDEKTPVMNAFKGNSMTLDMTTGQWGQEDTDEYWAEMYGPSYGGAGWSSMQPRDLSAVVYCSDESELYGDDPQR